MKIFYKRKQMLGLALSAAIVSNSLVVGNATGRETSEITEENIDMANEAVEVESQNDSEITFSLQRSTGGDTYKVVVDSLNVRKGPGTNHSVLGSLKEGTTIEVLSINDGWAKINFNGQIGYCSANTKYIEKTTMKYKVTVDSLNVRKGPGTNHSVLGSLKEGTIIEVSSINDGWAKINFNGQIGYCSANSKYIEKTTIVTTTTNSNASTSTTSTGKITEDVNLRATDSWNGTKLLVIKKGATVSIVSKGSEWTKVTYSGKTGYVPTEYISNIVNSGTNSNTNTNTNTNTSTTSTGKLTEDVNLRSTASWSGTKLLVIKKNTTVNIVSKGSEWTKVTYSGKTGYVPTEYISNIANSGTNSNTNTNTNTSTTSTGKLTEDVNLRSTASWSGTKLLVIKKNTTVNIVSKGSEWTKVTYSGKTGYVPTEYISSITNSGNTTESNKENMVTVTEPTWLRKSSSWSAEKIVTLSKGEKAEFISRSGDWIKVKYNGQEGYLSVDFVTNIPTIETPSDLKKYKVTADSLNVRNGAGTNYTKIGSLVNGRIIEVYSIESGWAKIKFNDGIGYVSADYITVYTESSNVVLNKKVYLDPGHGGADAGAIGTTYKTKEKDVALDVTKRVASKLKDKGYTVMESRTTDVYPSLAQRYNDANNKGADIFVSMHFNSASSSSAQGLETLYKVDGRTSNVLADQIQDEMIDATGLRNRGLKQRSDLAVLNGTKMPAVLIEGGFLSNSTEENLIKSSSYRETLANAIVKGIEDYFKVMQ